LSEIEAFTEFVYSRKYSDRLAANNIHAAWLGDELVGTGGWSPVAHNGALARIRSIFVRPLFNGLGIGRRLVDYAILRARKAGFTEFAVRAPVSAAGFFERSGFKVKSHGVQTLSPHHDIPVRFMRQSDVEAAIGRIGEGTIKGDHGVEVKTGRSLTTSDARRQRDQATATAGDLDDRCPGKAAARAVTTTVK